MTLYEYMLENGEIATDTAIKLSTRNVRQIIPDLSDDDDEEPQSHQPVLQMEVWQ